MYLLFFALLLLALFCINHWCRKKNIQKVNNLSTDAKYTLINELIEPFGYCYVPAQDIFTTHNNAWQRNMGYRALYDESAVHLNMVFDCLPVYFNYQGRTWLIEFWKGQYGINTGGEIGLYYADRILTNDELPKAHFRCVEDDDMLKMSLSLIRNDKNAAQLAGRHWWLTTFRLGCFSQPSELHLQTSITFSSPEMANAFINGLLNTGYSGREIYRYYNTISFTFAHSPKNEEGFRRLRIRIAQWSNQFWCKAYLHITRPFSLSVDRVLYLYYYLPFVFRKTLRIHKYKKNWKRGR